MEFVDIAKEAARAAGKILIDNLGKINKIEYKARNDLITEVDIESEKTIVNMIRDRYPDHSLIAEEGTLVKSSSEYRWIVDPLDGTMNYAHTYPFFCVSIALERKGEVICGVVYDPVKDEMFSAEVNKGAMLNGKSIKPSLCSSIEEGLFATGFLFHKEELLERNLMYFSDFIRKAQGVRRDGSAALDLCYVACGRYDGFWELGLNPWDMAAGAFIIKEAKGVVTNISGESFDPYRAEIVASNGILHKQMLDMLGKR